jgi:hypothetical protein
MKSNLKSFFSVKSLLRYFNTVRHLKWEQFFYRLYYPVKRSFYRTPNFRAYTLKSIIHLDRTSNFPEYSYEKQIVNPDQYSFCFLNRTQKFNQRIDWNIQKYGTLWLFHLFYFDWLNDDSLTIKFRLDTIIQFIDNQNNKKIFLHSYPASLRIPNWIKFLIKYNIQESKIKLSLLKQIDRLYHFPEYEIQGNHLLENGISLVWGGIYFDIAKYERLGIRILNKELAQQVLNDGVHFEKSFSYQSNIVKNIFGLLFFMSAHKNNNKLFNNLKIISSKLLSKLKFISDKTGYYPNFGDSNEQMSISISELLIVAQKLQINCIDNTFNESGYRLFVGKDYQGLINCGNVTAKFQPGHAHADALSYCLKVNNRHVIVDRGVSTYEIGAQRLLERSTGAHNTVCVEKMNSSDVWASFRMGKRALIKTLDDSNSILKISNYGYYYYSKIIHHRTIIGRENEIRIEDRLEGYKGQVAYSYIHFAPNIQLKKVGNIWIIIDIGVKIEFERNINTFLEDYEYCIGFNETVLAKRLVCPIENINTAYIIEIA